MPTDLLTSTLQFKEYICRNIVTIRESQDLFDDLTDDPDEYALAQELESQTKPSLMGTGLIDRAFDYGIIDFPFDVSNWAPTRFSDGSFGVFYGALDLDTTVYETVYHTLQDLDAPNFLVPGESVIRERRVYSVVVDAILYDCRDAIDEYPDLIHPHDYRFTNKVGQYINEQDRDGLITRSARCEGYNTPIFRRDRLSQVHDICFLTYIVDTVNEMVFVERAPGEIINEISWDDYDQPWLPIDL